MEVITISRICPPGVVGREVHQKSEATKRAEMLARARKNERASIADAIRERDMDRGIATARRIFATSKEISR